MFDLFGNSAKIRNLDTQMREVSRWSSDSALYQTPRMDFFPAKLTAYDSGTGYYSWTEQFYDTTGTRIDKPDAKTGTHTYMPAKLLNGAVITTFPFQVWLMRTIVSDTLGTIYEAVAALPFEEIDLIDKICVTKDEDGFVTDITIQRRTYLVAAYLASEVGTCTTSDEDCCPPVCTMCGVSVVLPTTLTITISLVGGGGAGCDPAVGSWPLSLGYFGESPAMYWGGEVDSGAGNLFVKVNCLGSDTLNVVFISNSGACNQVLVAATSDCDPLAWSGSASFVGLPAGCFGEILCAATGMTFIITE